jgi:putative membrane protein
MDGFVKIIRSGVICAAFAVLPHSAFAQTAPNPTPNPEAPSGQSADPSYDLQSRAKATQIGDRQFIKEAADGGMAEVELGQLAADKASRPEVKAFAERMVKDHSQANDQLKQIAAQKGVTLPSSPSAKHEAMKDKLSKLSGDAFDQAYMSSMLKDHQKDVAAFQKESTSGQDPDVKQFAAQTLPTLKDHLKQAESVSPKLTSSTTRSQ